MSSRAGSRPRTRGKQGPGGGGGHAPAPRPVTRARQRGYYSEISGLHAADNVGVSLLLGVERGGMEPPCNRIA